MPKKKFEIFIEDVGDSSVGMMSEQTFKAELCENMIQHLKENKLLGQFESKLEALVKEFYEPETYYRLYDAQDLEDEKRYYEELSKEETC